jgi:hypothetical protein
MLGGCSEKWARDVTSSLGSGRPQALRLGDGACQSKTYFHSQRLGRPERCGGETIETHVIRDLDYGIKKWTRARLVSPDVCRKKKKKVARVPVSVKLSPRRFSIWCEVDVRIQWSCLGWLSKTYVMLSERVFHYPFQIDHPPVDFFRMAQPRPE